MLDRLIEHAVYTAMARQASLIATGVTGRQRSALYRNSRARCLVLTALAAFRCQLCETPNHHGDCWRRLVFYRASVPRTA